MKTKLNQKDTRQSGCEPVSAEQLAYVASIKRKKRFVLICQITILLVFLFIWEITARLHIINDFIFCSPSKLLDTFLRMLQDGSLIHHIGISLFETLISFFIVIMGSLVIATLFWWNETISKILEPYLVVLNSLPKSALAPLLIVWLGANKTTIIICACSVAVFGSILNIYTGFMNVDPDKIKLIDTLKGTRLQSLYLVVLPSNVPNIISIMKVNIGLCLVGVIIGEFLAAREGLGYLIIYGSQVFKMSNVLLSILILCLIAMGLYVVLQHFEKKLNEYF